MIDTIQVKSVVLGTPTWMPVAWGELGVREVIGKKANPRILEYHKATNLGATSDEVAWCSAFVNWVMQRSGVASTKSAAARSWLHWGVPLVEPRHGCVAIYDRSSPELPAAGHVALWIAGVGDKDVVLGGNQNNSVCTALHSRATLLGYRWVFQQM